MFALMEIKLGGAAREVALEPGAGMPSLGFGGIHSFMSQEMLLTTDGHPQLRSVSLSLLPAFYFLPLSGNKTKQPLAGKKVSLTSVAVSSSDGFFRR